MPRSARQISESGYYHVILRGIGKQILFEERGDALHFLSRLQRYREELHFGLLAYCLMENHVHLLIYDQNRDLEQIMKKIAGSYARYYNDKYERTGHLFQDRFLSEAVEDDRYLLTVIRYIHMNPVKAGSVDPADYQWSSYSEYLNPKSQVIDHQLPLELLGGPEGFLSFMKLDEEDRQPLDVSGNRRKTLSDAAALAILKNELHCESGTQLQKMGRTERDQAIRLLRSKGLSVRQIERLTGINRGIVQKLL